MSEKRRDKKGRLLRTGESQRADGKYEYKYTDNEGKRRSVYSWRLVESDRTPNGKRDCEPLRDMIKNIDEDLRKGVNSWSANKTTLDMLFDEYISSKKEVKETTGVLYRNLYKEHIQPRFGKKIITTINRVAIKKFYFTMLNEKQLSARTIEILHAILNSMFSLAVDCKLLTTLPTRGVLREVSKSENWVKDHRRALTTQEQELFLRYAPMVSKCYQFYTLLLGTGMRLSEACGLRWCDIDFDTNFISVNHILRHAEREGGGNVFYVSSPKTASSVRLIPMLSDIRNMLLAEYERQKRDGFSKLAIDGYTDFVFTRINKDGKECPYDLFFITYDLGAITKFANRAETDKYKTETPPCLLPKITSHMFRHTFCTRMCESNVNIKILQEIMGHKNISTTMNVYAEATKEKRLEEIRNVEGLLKVC